MCKIILNPPPSDNRCEQCKRHIDELQPFGRQWKSDEMNDKLENAKLIKNYRDFQGCVGASWECKDCFWK